MKKILKIFSLIIKKPFFLKANDITNDIIKKILQGSYKLRQYAYSEGSLERPSNDYDIAVNYRWGINGDTYWALQSSFCRYALSLFNNRKVIELCCANGWMYREIYYWYDNLIYYGYDLNKDNIEEATRKLLRKEKKCKRKANAVFDKKNILKDVEIYEVDATHVFFFAALSMFSQRDRRIIINCISKALKKNRGIFCGNAGVVLEGQKQWDLFIGLYKNDAEVRDELELFFSNVYIMPRTEGDETVYFMASDGELPFYNIHA